MEIVTGEDCSGVDWALVAETLKRVGMAHFEPEKHRRAFEASAVRVFLYSGNDLVGFGRAITDGVYQAAIYDCAVRPEFQGQGLGRRLVEALLSRIGDCNTILYAAPGKEGFYEALGFRKMRTGMARFRNATGMRERGFTE